MQETAGEPGALTLQYVDRLRFASSLLICKFIRIISSNLNMKLDKTPEDSEITDRIGKRKRR